MKYLLLIVISASTVFGQASPVRRTKLYAGVPTAGDCTASTIGVLTGINTTADPDGIYECVDIAATPTWQLQGAGGGSVSSVGLALPAIFTVSGSPVTGSGTLTGTLANQTANLIWAGPGSGAAAAPTFRSLVLLDIPDLSSVYQPLNTNLTAIGGLAPSRGGLIRRGASAWEAVALGSTASLLYSDGTDAVWLARVSAASTIDFASVNDGACLENTFTLTGAALGDPVAMGVDTALPAGVSATARVSALNTAQIQVCNLSGATVDLSSRSWTARVVR